MFLRPIFIGGILLAGATIFVGGFLAYNNMLYTPAVSINTAQQTTQQNLQPNSAPNSNSANSSNQVGQLTTTQSPTSTNTSTTQKVWTDDELLAIASNKYANGLLPLGDGKYVIDAPKKGYIYLCNVHTDQAGAQSNGPWIQGNTWNYFTKTMVQGKISWPNATFKMTVTGNQRILSSNDLPLNQTTGKFPIQSSDPAAQYDRNPNSIVAQNITDAVPAQPIFSPTPYCMGGEAGMMLNGVPLFDGFDAELRDAAAHELQDSCDGHPQESGEYHYHSLSRCFSDISEKTVLGYALDGFPITGPMIAPNKYLTTDDLDECHGLTSEIIVNGQKTITYHYVMTQDFPYSISCFRSKPIQPAGLKAGPRTQNGTNGSSRGSNSGGGLLQLFGNQGSQGHQTSSSLPQGQGNQSSSFGQQPQTGGQGSIPSGQQQAGQGQPPQEALTACNNKNQGDTCSFTTQNGDSILGSCQTPPGTSSLACVPAR